MNIGPKIKKFIVQPISICHENIQEFNNHMASLKNLET
jgi:hypothetical protein